MTEADAGPYSTPLATIFEAGPDADGLDDEPDPEPSLRERIKDWYAADDDIPIRPSVEKLSRDQADLLIRLLDGFDDRSALIEWNQELAIHSLGELPDEWFVESATDATTVSALLGEPWGPCGGVDAATAAETRRGYATEYIIPAFRQALHTFRWSSTEHVEQYDPADGLDDGTDQSVIDHPERAQWPAMRPELGRLSDRQDDALGQLLDGFESPEYLLMWGHKVTAASYAEINKETVSGAYFDATTRRYLSDENDDPRKGRFFREAWASKYLIPAFNAAARSLADRSTEVAAPDEPDLDDDARGGLS